MVSTPDYVNMLIESSTQDNITVITSNISLYHLQYSGLASLTLLRLITKGYSPDSNITIVPSDIFLYLLQYNGLAFLTLLITNKRVFP